MIIAKRSSCLTFVFGLLISWNAASTNAAEILWDGGTSGTNFSWITPGNWVGDVLPGAGDDIRFVTVGNPLMTMTSASLGVRTFIWDSTSTGQLTNATTGATSRTLTLNGTGVATDRLVSILQGNFSILGPNSSSGTGRIHLSLGSSGQLYVAPDSSLTITSNILENVTGVAIEKTGAGILTLGGSNEFSGGLKISEGTVNFSSALHLGNINNLTTIADGARLRWQGTGNVDLASSRQFSLSGGNAYFDVLNNVDWEISGIISGSGKLVKDGLGTLTLNTVDSGGNTFTGGVSVVKGVLYVNNTNRLGPAPSTYTPDFITLNGGTIRFDLSTNIFNANRGFTIGAFDGTVDVADAQSVTTLSRVVGIGGLTKTGAGTFVLANPINNYAGPTIVNAGQLRIATGATADTTTTVNVSGGILRVDGLLDSSGGVTIGIGGTLTGVGVVQDSLTLNSQATLSPGNSVGVLTVSGASNSWNAGSSVYFEFKTPGTSDAAAGTDWDYLNLTGSSLALTGPITLRIDALQSDGVSHATLTSQNPFDPVAGTYHMLFVRTAGVTGFTADTFQVQDNVANFGVFGTGNAFTPSAGQFWVSLEGNDLYLNYAAVPEPSSLLLLGVAYCGWGLHRRRRRKNVAAEVDAPAAALT